MSRRIPGLTPRELEILRLRCAHGLTNNEIGERLFISGQTVKNHLTTVFRKWGFSGSAMACYRLGREDAEGQRITAIRASDL